MMVETEYKFDTPDHPLENALKIGLGLALGSSMFLFIEKSHLHDIVHPGLESYMVIGKFGFDLISGVSLMFFGANIGKRFNPKDLPRRKN